MPVLIVDLDGTLLRSDMLFETFWASFGTDWRAPFKSVLALKGGRSGLKHMLAENANIDPTSLPYDPEIIAYINKFKSAGGRTALVTASNQALAELISDHLGIFDEVHGSDHTSNLKGQSKADFLADRFGESKFIYMGDAVADLPVWSSAERVITVNAPVKLRREAEALGKPIEHLVTQKPSLKPYIRALRSHQWLKNILIFLPILAGHQFTVTVIFQSVLAFIAFSLVASSVYVLNDLLDLKADRAHPRKRERPFASGAIPISHGGIMAGTLLGLGVAVSVLLGWHFLMTMFIYFVLTTAYSLHLKRRIVIDICVLAGLYTMRILAGGIATDIPLSVWLLAFSIFFFFSLAAVKRQAELVDLASRNELTASGRGYTVEDLPIMSMISLGSGYVSVLVMALYVNSPAVLQLYKQPAALWAICCILLYWITRMVLITHRGEMHDDPVVFAAKDGTSQLCLIVILVFGIAGVVL